MTDLSVPRRRFVARAAAGVAGLATLSAGSYARVLGSNERIQMGVIGAGNRARRLMGIFREQGCVFPAVCDCYEAHQGLALEIAGSGARPYADHRSLLDSKEVDAVLVGTPDHWHHDQLIDALAAGKDVYLEKPFSLSIEQGARMVEAARRTDRIVQVGMQRRSAPAVLAAKAMIDEGRIGPVHLVRAHWFWDRTDFMEQKRRQKVQGKLDWDRFVGPARSQPFDPIRYFYWRVFWDFSGGHCTDQGTHLMDVVQWFCHEGRPPQAAVCLGATYRMAGSETPDTFSAVFQYPNLTATWTLTYANSRNDSWAIAFHGTRGYLELSDHGVTVYGHPWSQRGGREPEPAEVVPGTLPSEPHVANFLECVRTRKQPNAPVEVGHAAVTGPHLANLSLRRGGKAVLAPDGASAQIVAGA